MRKGAAWQREKWIGERRGLRGIALLHIHISSCWAPSLFSLPIHLVWDPLSVDSIWELKNIPFIDETHITDWHHLISFNCIAPIWMTRCQSCPVTGGSRPAGSVKAWNTDWFCSPAGRTWDRLYGSLLWVSDSSFSTRKTCLRGEEQKHGEADRLN